MISIRPDRKMIAAMTDAPEILTIDVGTGSVRAGLVGIDGRLRALNAIAHPTHLPQHGWIEQSPLDWWDGACLAIRRTLAEGGASRVIGITCCGQMHAPVLIDQSGTLTRSRSPLWNDKRAARVADAIAEKIHASRIPAPVNPPTSAWPGIKLAWSVAEEPDVLERSRWLLMPKDWINFRLTGEVAVDWTEAGSSFISDPRSSNWSADLASLIGIDPTILPPILPCTQRIGSILAEVATDLGLPQGLPVFGGAGDFPVAMLGSGVTEPGNVSDVTGTSFLLTCLRSEPLLSPDVMNVALASGGWGSFAVVDAAGDAVRWAARTLDQDQHSYEHLSRLASGISLGAEGLMFLPYLTGERLGQGAGSRAAFLGLTAQHSAAHLHRAVMEGVILAMNQAYSPILKHAGKPEAIISAAGGAKSDLWLSIKADVFGCPVITPEEPEAGLIGAACLGFTGAGFFGTPAEAARSLVRYRPPINPVPSRHAAYQEMAAAFREIRYVMQSINSAIGKLVS